MDRITELQKKLQSVTGEEKVNILNDIAFAFYNIKIEKTEQYALQANILAKEIDFPNGVSRSYNLIGISYHRRSEYSKALKFYNKALAIYVEAEDRISIAAVKNNMGAVYEKQSDLHTALEYYFVALTIWDESGNRQRQSVALNNIGIIFEKEEDYDKALEYHFKSLEIKKELDHDDDTAIALDNIGLIYQKLENYDLALEYSLQALKIKEKSKEKRSLAISYTSMGNIYFYKKNYKKSIEYYQMAQSFFEEFQDKYGITICYAALGRIYTATKDYELAEKYLIKSSEIAHKAGIKLDEMNSFEGLSALFESKKDFEKALKYQRKQSKIEKEIYSEQRSKLIAEMEAKYETEKKQKEAEIFRLKNVELVSANEKLTQEILDHKKTEEELNENKKYLSIINKILRHDLANNFVVIKSALRIYNRNNSETKMLIEINNRVDKSLELIKRLQAHESFIDTHSFLTEYNIREVIDSLIDSYPDIELKIEGFGTAFADESIYSVFDNIISNSINHGESKKIDISISQKNKFCEIAISDFGKGIPDKIKGKIFNEGFVYGEKAHTGIGLYIVQQTIRRYAGNVIVKDNKPRGTTFIVNLLNVLK